MASSSLAHRGSIIESPGHPLLDCLYQRLGIEQVKLSSQREALQALKKTQPDCADQSRIWRQPMAG